MTEPAPILDLPTSLGGMEPPTVGRWNPLEGRPRTQDPDRALRAEVRDPLWMLTWQWQLGEFEGLRRRFPGRRDVLDRHVKTEPVPAGRRRRDGPATRPSC
jgi:hypothetical protein